MLVPAGSGMPDERQSMKLDRKRVIVSNAPRVVQASRSNPKLSKSRTSKRRANVTGSKEGKVVELKAGSSRSRREVAV